MARKDQVRQTGEPRLEDLMHDPIVRMVMRRDGVTDEMIMTALRSAAARNRVAA